MKRTLTRIAAVGLVLVIAAGIAAPQIKQVIKVIGVGAAVKQFGPDINKQFNKLTGHKDTNASFTKVVPIITVGVHARGAIGAAQVMGARTNVQKVVAVASPEVSMFGEINLRAMIPINSMNVTSMKDIHAVDGVGVSGIVDLRL